MQVLLIFEISIYFFSRFFFFKNIVSVLFILHTALYFPHIHFNIFMFLADAFIPKSKYLFKPVGTQLIELEKHHIWSTASLGSIQMYLAVILLMCVCTI